MKILSYKKRAKQKRVFMTVSAPQFCCYCVLKDNNKQRWKRLMPTCMWSYV